MGAIGVRQTITQLQGLGFKPIELERYCGSNKIWQTKIKRLRLPDLLCVETGVRTEVRAKSDLKIRMSDAPGNPARTWDAGLRDEDLVAFISIIEDETGQRAAKEGMFFRIKQLRDSFGKSVLGPAKSASEGAERDRTWPAVVPSGNGIVRQVTAERLIVDIEREGRPRQTYNLQGKSSYVAPGQRFLGRTSIIAGAPTHLADVRSYLNHAYNPLEHLDSVNAVDRYAATKAIPYRDDLKQHAIGPLEELLRVEQEPRIALEAAGSLASIGSALGQDRIEETIWGESRNDLRMEAVLILTELATPFASDELVRVASDRRTFQENEIRQAAVWGLGRSGLKAYEKILPFIDDREENVAAHAIVAFGNDTPEKVIRSLTQDLIDGDSRRAAAASEVLRLIANDIVLRILIDAATTTDSEWILATLGRLPGELVRPAIANTTLMPKVAPLLLLGEGDNWLANKDRVMDIAFLTQQNYG